MKIGTRVLLDVADAIRRTDFVMVIVTGQDVNTYLEVGFALGARKPILLLIGSTEESSPKIPSDIYMRGIVYQHVSMTDLDAIKDTVA
jgi:nucleoside 2-deoxyribosyltransferase